MALETRSSRALDTVHRDVLSQARLACYKARDAFYTCLEKEANKKPTEIASVGLLYPVECKKNREEYVKQCRPTWVKHFDRQYCAKKRVQRLLDDNEPRRGLGAARTVQCGDFSNYVIAAFGIENGDQVLLSYPVSS